MQQSQAASDPLAGKPPRKRADIEAMATTSPLALLHHKILCRACSAASLWGSEAARWNDRHQQGHWNVGNRHDADDHRRGRQGLCVFVAVEHANSEVVGRWSRCARGCIGASDPWRVDW